MENPYNIKLKSENGKTIYFDQLRKKWLLLTPEEWVRQNFLQYLNQRKNYPISRFAIETSLKYNERKKRADLVFYQKDGSIGLLIECKAPDVKITQEVFNQIAVYNTRFKAKYLVVTNGNNSYCCHYTNDYSWQFIPEIPDYIE